MLLLERVQRRFTILTQGMKDLTHEERLRTLGLYSMEFGRMRKGDIIVTYRIMKAWIDGREENVSISRRD